MDWGGIVGFGYISARAILPGIGEKIATETGLGETFVGSIFIALATTLPELTVSLTAYRIGAVDMAVGNLFGSNLFNVSMLALDDFFYVAGPLLNHVSATHLVSIIGTISMTAVAVIGLTFRATRKRFLLSWEALTIAAICMVTSLLLYRVNL